MPELYYPMRRPFIYKDGSIKISAKRGISCYQWLVKDGDMSEEELANTVHGHIYPGRVYFYKGVKDAYTDAEVEAVAERCRSSFDSSIEICCGAFPGKEGEVWEPVKIIGHGTAD